jgi:hypothetical protein
MADWLLISYHVPTHPSALRVATWRALKQLGAVSLSDGLYALPATDPYRTALLQLGSKISEGGGVSISFHAKALTQDDEHALQEKFEAARHDEYRQVAKSAAKLVDHIDREEESGDYRLAEVDSLEEELNKVRRQLERAVARDAVGLAIREDAESALAKAELRLQEYVDHAYRQENSE